MGRVAIGHDSGMQIGHADGRRRSSTKITKQPLLSEACPFHISSIVDFKISNGTIGHDNQWHVLFAHGGSQVGFESLSLRLVWVLILRSCNVDFGIARD